MSGWHAADGNGNGNRRTIAIECIMSKNYTDTDKKAEDNAARLAAYLLKIYHRNQFSDNNSNYYKKFQYF